MLCFLVFLPFINNAQQLKNNGQELKYKECTNCDNTTTSGSMPVPTNGFTYSSEIECFLEHPEHIKSDFGPRTEGTRYHLGIDISPQYQNNDIGDAIFPIEPGTVKKIYVSKKYKYIVFSGTHYYGFGHIFFWGWPDESTGMRSGDFILKKMDGVNSDNYAIVHCPNGGTPIAISELNSGTVTVPSINNGNPMFQPPKNLDSISENKTLILQL